MHVVALGLLSLILAAEPQPSAPPEALARQSIERSLPLLEKGAVEWMQTRKCATCHHIPMMLWTHYEAQRAGFTVNTGAMQELERQAISHYLDHPELTPTGQDTGFMEKGLGPGTIYLSLALQSNRSPSDETVKGLQRFRDNFFARQNENGSWTTKVNQAPLVDDHDGMTLLTLAALGDQPLDDKARNARERAIQWLKDVPLREQSQTLALRVLVSVQGNDPAEAARCLARLRQLQQSDGGWNQTAELSTDALATGQALYAMGVAGVAADDPAVQRARQYLTSSQREDGSWLVHTRNPNSHDAIISFYGTGWATLGLIRTLPAGE